MTRILLHACCGPCSLEPVKALMEEGFVPMICWTNPNIQPLDEHELRLSTLLAWARDTANLEVIIAGDD
ncbi:MAG: epoxyqueuosine reductase QueH, partial [Atopobiaceae bacterium]|nr:epoxyqueuosine reductase QueH [Atopobiaceae bacterium]